MILSALSLLLLPALPLGDEEPQQNCTQIVFFDEYGPDDALWASPGSAPRLQVPKAVLGAEDSLTQVTITVSGSAGGSLGVENTNVSDCVAFPGWSMSLGILPVGTIPGVSLVPFEQSQLLTVPLQPYDGQTDFGGDSGETITLPKELTFEQQFVVTKDLAVFVDSAPGDGESEFLEFDHFALGTPSTRSTCGIESLWDAQATFRVDIEYTICSAAVPCPTGTVLTSPDADATEREQAILYNVRDQQLATSVDGRELIRRFYLHAQEAHVLFMNHSDLRRRAAKHLREILPRFEDALAGKPARLTEDEQRSIQVLIRDLKPLASPKLRETLNDLSRGVRSGSLTDMVGLRRTIVR